MTPTIVRQERHGPAHLAVVITYTNHTGTEAAVFQLYHDTDGMVKSLPFRLTENAVNHFNKFVCGVSA